MSTFSKDDGIIRHRSAPLRTAIASFATLGFLPAFVAPFIHKPEGEVLARVGFPLLYLLVIAVGAAVWQKGWRTRSAKLRADRAGLWIDGKCEVRRASIRQAYTVTNEHGMFLRLMRRGPILRSLDVAVADQAEADELLAALQLDAAHTVADYEVTAGSAMALWKRVGVTLAGFFGALALDARLLLHGAPPTAGMRQLAFVVSVFVIAFFALSVLALVVPRTLRVSVGADGVRIYRRGFIGGKTTFHPYSSIASVKTEGSDIQLRLVDGTSVDMHQASSGKAVADHELEARDLVQRIERQLAIARAAPVVSAQAVARNGRTAEEWVKDAAALRESQATFRTPVIPAEQLWSIVEDATASASERAGAALALRHDLDADTRQRLRVAAEACAAPKLRVALETVASEADEQALTVALAELDDQRRAMPMRRVSK